MDKFKNIFLKIGNWDFVRNNKGFIDFNILIPCPQSINKTHKYCSEPPKNIKVFYIFNEIYKKYGLPEWNTFNKKVQELIIKLNMKINDDDIKDIHFYYNYERFRYYSWNDWRLGNWGTSWNADEQHQSMQNYFSTAQNIPTKWLESLAKKTDFVLCFANEGMDMKCGYVIVKNNNIQIVENNYKSWNYFVWNDFDKTKTISNILEDFNNDTENYDKGAKILRDIQDDRWNVLLSNLKI